MGSEMCIRDSLWFVADENIDYQQTALAVSHVPFLKNPEKVKEVISEDCLKSLLSAPEHSKIGIRDTTIMVILYDSAIRLSELLNLKISDVANYAQTECQFRYCGTAIPFLTVRSTAR